MNRMRSATLVVKTGSTRAAADGLDTHDKEQNRRLAVNQEVLIERLFQALISGDRNEARAIVAEATNAGVPAEELATGLFWPVLNMVQRLHRADQLAALSHHFATRLLRSLADQIQPRFAVAPRNERRVMVVCGNTEQDELGASMAADLVEAGGFDVCFVGGGVPFDEIMARVGEDRPNVLLLFSSAAADLPEVRRLIDTLHEQNVCHELQIVVGGGVYGRAEGLAEEIGADLFVPDLADLVPMLREKAAQRARSDQRTVGRKRRVKAA